MTCSGKRLPKSWSVEAAAIDPTKFDLSVKNPNGNEEVTHRSPDAILDEIAALDAESAEVLQTIRGLIGISINGATDFTEVTDELMGRLIVKRPALDP